jgi:hypothetical protein
MNNIEGSSDVAVEGLYVVFTKRMFSTDQISEQQNDGNVERNDTASNVRW